MVSNSGAGPATKKLKLDGDSAGPSTETQSKAERKKAKKAKKLDSKAFMDSLPGFSFDGNDLKARSQPVGID
ncbi:hypothetical protein FRB90_009355, partial [Tulasnella sp. 427]